MNELIQGIAKSAERAACLRPEDYRDRDGYWVCGRCNTRKQCDLPVIPNVLPKPVRVYCLCKCEEDKLRREKAKEKVVERKENLRSEGLSDMDSQAAMSMTLDKDDGSFPFMSNLAKKYTQNWQTIYKSGKGGLILWGSPGTGKTYFATAIGNAIREQGVSVGRVTAANLVEALSGMYDGERKTKVQMLNYCDLLILDDLGAERDTQYGREVIFSLVDDRYKRKKPLIVTTNLTMKQMQEPMTRKGEVDMGYKRIFDRVLGMGTPVQMSGESHRRQEGREGRDLMRGLR